MPSLAFAPVRGKRPPRHPVLDEPAGGWRAKVLSFPGGGFESVVSWQEPADLARLRDAARGPRRHGKKGAEDVDALASSRARAKRGVRLACKVRQVKRMWTLSTREVLPLWEGAKSLRSAYRRFVVLMQRQGYWGEYVAVYELHPNGLPGHYHLHVAVDDEYIPHELVLLCWHKALGWKGLVAAKGEYSPGAVRFSKIPPKAQSLSGLARSAWIAQYMSKYMAKGGDSELLNKKRYWVSKAGFPLVERIWLDGVGTREEALAEFQRLFAVDLGQVGNRVWLFPDGPGFWVEYAPMFPEFQPPPPF